MKNIFGILLVFMSLVDFSTISQVLLNNGANIITTSGAYVHVNGTLTNELGTYKY